MPTEVVHAPGHERSRSLGWLATAWMEALIIHGPGDIQGTSMDPNVPGSIPLSDELTTLTVDCYALDAKGRRLYDAAFYSRPKGADKSGQAARFALFEAMGPCRFKGWAKGGEVYEFMDFRYVYEPGEAMGTEVTYPFIRVLATEEGQAGNVYDNIYFNLKEGPLSEVFRQKDDVGLTRVFLPGEDGGEIRPSTASSSAKDGGKETWTDFDETHLYILPELRRMYDTVRRNMLKRKIAEPWAFESSTMYAPGQNSIAERSHDLAKAIRAGKIRNPRFLFDHRQAPENTDWGDPESILAGLQEAYGDATSYMDLEKMVDYVLEPGTDRQDSMRFFGNVATSQAGAAFDIASWRKNRGSGEPPPAGSLITLGFDGSLSDDATALIGTDVVTGKQWPVGIWESQGDDWEIDKAEVMGVVEEVFRTYQVWRMLCDPSKWESQLSEWAGAHGDKVVISYPTTLARRMAATLKAYAGAIVAGEVTNNGDPVQERHVGNAIKAPLNYTDDDGMSLWLISKKFKGSPDKIDAAMAGAMSWQARLDAVAAGATAVDERSVYEDRGLFSV